MRDRKFDSLARQFATPTSRRAGLRMLFGTGAALLAAARGASTAAQYWKLPLGEACYDDSQCDAGVVCDDNGFAYDGPWNCCMYDYGSCSFDEHCCGDRTCVDFTCTPPQMGNGSRALGEYCEYPEQCYSGGCSDNGVIGPVCCQRFNDLCVSFEDCCGSLVCLDGICTVPYEGGMAGSLGLGEQCGDSAQCISGTCADNQIDPGGICCSSYGGGCQSNRHCCGSLLCEYGSCTVPYEGYG
jgi:hypothetical protein